MKNYTLTFIWLFFGILGGHRFYLQMYRSAFLMLVLLPTGISLVWWFYDGYLIYKGKISTELSNNKIEKTKGLEKKSDNNVLTFVKVAFVILVLIGFYRGFAETPGKQNEITSNISTEEPKYVQIWSSGPISLNAEPNAAADIKALYEERKHKNRFVYTKSTEDWVYIQSKANADISGWIEKKHLIKIPSTRWGRMMILLFGLVAAVLTLVGLFAIIAEVFFGGGYTDAKKDLRFKTGFKNNQRPEWVPKNVPFALFLAGTFWITSAIIFGSLYIKLFFI